jgi:hypothetical protein
VGRIRETMGQGQCLRFTVKSFKGRGQQNNKIGIFQAAEEDKLLEPTNLVRRKYLPISRSHRKYSEKFTHKLTSMSESSYSAKWIGITDLSVRSKNLVYKTERKNVSCKQISVQHSN